MNFPLKIRHNSDVFFFTGTQQLVTVVGKTGGKLHTFPQYTLALEQIRHTVSNICQTKRYKQKDVH